MTPLLFQGISGKIHRAKRTIAHGPHPSDYEVMWCCGVRSKRALMCTGAGGDYYFFSQLARCEGCFRPDRAKTKHQANRLVAVAIASGDLSRGTSCEECGKPDAVRPSGKRELVAHHDDYSFPLVVRWLCHKCHRAWHRSNDALLPVEVAS